LAVAKLPPFAMIFFPGFHALIGSGMGWFFYNEFDGLAYRCWLVWAADAAQNPLVSVLHELFLRFPTEEPVRNPSFHMATVNYVCLSVHLSKELVLIASWN
jgi:hypothetical protein